MTLNKNLVERPMARAPSSSPEALRRMYSRLTGQSPVVIPFSSRSSATRLSPRIGFTDGSRDTAMLLFGPTL